MTHDLTSLANNRDVLLLTEVAAFLHDWQKCIGYWKKIGAQFDPSDIASVLESFKPQAPLNPSTPTESSSLKYLIEQGKDPSRAKHHSDWRIKLLGTCHGIAHVDKPMLQGLGENTSLVASVFGYETSPQESSLNLYKAVKNINQRHVFLKELEQSFNNAVGDTRRPLNEVRLWEWGAATAAFWKAIAARYVLENKVTENNLKWRILSVRFDGLGFLEQSLTIGDLLGRRTALQASLNCVRKLLEETYPIGNEVYRDENGSAFIVPELENDSDGKQLHDLLENQILNSGWLSELDGELKPRIHVTESHKEAIVLHKALEQTLPRITPFKESSTRWWQGEITDICTVCSVRPQGWGTSRQEQRREAKSRKICHVCLERRDKRAKAWSENLRKTDKETVRDTIWIDEIADENGRLALVIGQFNLNNWLNGDMIKSLLAICNPASDTNKNPSLISKEPSFARIQRVWKTTQRFWQEVLIDARDSALPVVKGRLTIESTNLAEFGIQAFGNYDLVLGKTKLSVLHYNGELITTDKLRYTAKQLSAKCEEYVSDETAAEFVRSQLLNQQVAIEEPTGYGSPNKLRGKLNISNVTFDATKYNPVIPILAEPRTFMALVPAEKSLDVIKAIQTKYDREMGKVRDRLPLHLGVVYFQRRTPLRSALDAGRQMLSYKSSDNQRRTPLRSALDAGRQMLSYKSSDNQQLWQVQSKTQGQLPDEKKEVAKGTKQFDETIILKLIQGDRTITWHVPAKMGDGTTEDVWYPYVFLETNGDDNQVNGRQRAIKSMRPGETTPCWLVHAADLQERDQIYFTPSTFDFEFLDTTARRFEIYYDDEGRRSRRTRPFYLEDLDRFEKLWAILKALETSQRHQVIYAIETTRETWYGQDEQESLTDSVFSQFVTDTLANATWTKDYKKWTDIPPEQRQQLIDAGVRGELADLAELHMEILKER